MNTHTARRRYESSHMPVLLLALILTLGIFVAPQVATAVQVDPGIDHFDYRIYKVNCEEVPPPAFLESVGGEPPGPITTPLPPTCEPAEGVAFTITDTEGNELGGCTTNENGMCTASLPPVEQNIVIEEDESTAKPGYSPMKNPIETSTFLNEFNPHRENFINVRDDVPELPKTGVGPRDVAWTHSLAGVVAVLATLLALSGALIRRQGERILR